MLLSVPGGTSRPSLPATVTVPVFVGCLNWRWLPLVLASFHSSASNSFITSLTFNIYYMIMDTDENRLGWLATLEKALIS